LIDGFADKKNLRERQRQYQNLIGSIAEIDADLASTQIQIGETKLQIIQLDKEFEEEVANQLSQLQVEISDMSERITALQDRLTRTAIRAPVSGKVLGLTVHTIGGVIAPGAPILSIVPDGSELTITAEVSPIDIDRVVIGLEAEVRFSSFKRSTTPQLYGRVIHISPDRFINEHSGEAYYQVLVELSQDSVIALQELQLVPGMPADVLISSGERTLFQYLAQPVTDAFVNSFLED
jgi:epimerase transport system membrane fusion protein